MENPKRRGEVVASLEKNDVNVIAQYSRPSEAKRSKLYKETDDCVVVTQARFEDHEHGLNFLANPLKRRNPALIILTDLNTESTLSIGYKRGCGSYLSTDVSAEELREAIIQVAAGRKYIPGEVTERLIELNIINHAPTVSDLAALLDDSEIEMLTLLGDGYTEKEISEAFSYSRRTITYKKANIKKKLGVTRLSSLTKIALKHALIAIDDLE